MSGHSKWANTKRRKQAVDAKRGNIFTKLSIAIATAVKMGGDSPDTNWKLKGAIEDARVANMPNDNIMRTIKKAAGNSEDSNYDEIMYEGYGPCGVAIIVEAMTNNKNRTAGDLRYIFDKFGGNLGTSGCVSFLFDKKGLLFIDKENTNLNEDELMENAIDAGAEDFYSSDDGYEILTSSEDFHLVKSTLQSKGYHFSSANIQMLPNILVKIEESKHAESMDKLLDKLDELDDVQNVYCNWDRS